MWKYKALQLIFAGCTEVIEEPQCPLQLIYAFQ